jgi:hypothetical protein
LSDIVPVAGIADDPAFLKWQLDILPEGDPDRALFVATNTTPRPSAGNLTTLDTMRYPDGAYTLRLRIVRKDHNYDEYLTPILIDNSDFTASANGLTAPEEGAVLSGTVSVEGVVDLPQFRRWELYLDTVEEPVGIDQLARRVVPVRQPARLLNFDTTTHPDGEYVLRLRAVQRDGNWEEYTRFVRIENGPLPADLPADNGIAAPVDGATVEGNVAVVGVAHDPQFLKWQLDLLLDGDPQRAAPIDLGEGRPVEQPARLTTLNTTRYPNGTTTTSTS